ncbi:hypothetical protein GQ600_11921 [Phytophthora cactorum]|nr:hypothetical protein GQ600_11921 [Phytophthora cactorum]
MAETADVNFPSGTGGILDERKRYGRNYRQKPRQKAAIGQANAAQDEGISPDLHQQLVSPEDDQRLIQQYAAMGIARPQYYEMFCKEKQLRIHAEYNRGSLVGDTFAAVGDRVSSVFGCILGAAIFEPELDHDPPDPAFAEARLRYSKTKYEDSVNRLTALCEQFGVAIPDQLCIGREGAIVFNQDSTESRCTYSSANLVEVLDVVDDALAKTRGNADGLSGSIGNAAASRCVSLATIRVSCGSEGRSCKSVMRRHHPRGTDMFEHKTGYKGRDVVSAALTIHGACDRCPVVQSFLVLNATREQSVLEHIHGRNGCLGICTNIVGILHCSVGKVEFLRVGPGVTAHPPRPGSEHGCVTVADATGHHRRYR